VTEWDTERQSEHQETDRQASGACRCPELELFASGDLAHDGQEDQTHHIVHDRGAEDDLTFAGSKDPQLRKNPRCDPDRGRREGRSDEDRGQGRVAEGTGQK
jgi:hypothetical protein